MLRWMFESWLEDYQEKREFVKEFTIFGGFFHNPEMAKRMLKEPDAVMDDEDMDKIMKDLDKPLSRRERKRLHLKKKVI